MFNNYQQHTAGVLAAFWKKVGETPMAEITYRYQGGPVQRIWAKLEYENGITHSIKDRMALYVIQKAFEDGRLKKGDQIVEATSGNTGIAMAAIGKALGHKVKIIMPDWMSKERIALLKNYGAEVQLISRQEGGFVGSIRLAELHQHNERVFLPRQFENKYNVESHEKTTGREIGHQLLLNEQKPAAFVAGVGTGGTVMGVGRYLRVLFPQIRVHPLEPAESPTLSTGHQVGTHRIQGISDEFIPEIVDLKALDQVIQVNDGDAILMAQTLHQTLGLPVGISSGANFLGAVKVQQEMGGDPLVITVFADGQEKYKSTALFGPEPVRPGYLSPGIRLISAKVL